MLTSEELSDIALAAALVSKIQQSIRTREAKPVINGPRLYRRMTAAERTWCRLKAAKSSLLLAYREETGDSR